MSNIDTATYIKKLIKLVYQKENQIETLKKELRNHPRNELDSPPLEQGIRNELCLTAAQLREVNQKMNHMEARMVELELGLEEEIAKNNQLEEEISRLKEDCLRLQQEKGHFISKLDEITAENMRLKVSLESQEAKREETQMLQTRLQCLQRETAHISETLKDYEQFAFEISSRISLAHSKHCDNLHSSGKENIFEGSFRKIGQVQIWMDFAAERLGQHAEMPNHTLENLSVILRSQEGEELDRNEEELISNLEKECEKSLERSKLVELGEVKEVLKMTKEVNRQLMEQVNHKEYLLNECKRLYQHMRTSNNSQDFNELQKLLDRF